MQSSGPRIEVSQEGDVTIAHLLDEEVLEDFVISEIAESLFALVLDKGSVKLVLSFANVKHLSSSALGTLIRLNKRVEESDGLLCLCDLIPSLYEIFVITKLNKLFSIYDNKEMAVSSLKS